jgi:hypothetical protein
MELATPLIRRTFRRRLFGYDPRQVDSHLAEAAAVHDAARSEIERLRVAEPLTRVGGDIAALLASFADTMASLRDQAQGEAHHTVEEAESYAREMRAEADRALEEAKARARAEAAELLGRASQEISALAEHQATVERALRDAASGVQAALEALHRLADLPSPVDLAEMASADGVTAAEPVGDVAAESEATDDGAREGDADAERPERERPTAADLISPDIHHLVPSPPTVDLVGGERGTETAATELEHDAGDTADEGGPLSETADYEAVIRLFDALIRNKPQ